MPILRLFKSGLFWAIVGGLACIGGTAFVVSQPKLYRATAVLEWIPPKPFDLHSAGADTAIRSSEMDLNTYLQIIQSRRIAADVLAAFTLDEFRLLLATSGNGAAIQPLGKIYFTTSGQRLPVQIPITTIHANPQAAVLVANRYAAVFLSFLESVSVRNIKSIRTQLNGWSTQLRDAESESEAAKISTDSAKLRAAERRLANARERVEQLQRDVASASKAQPVAPSFRISTPAEKAVEIPWWQFR